MIPLGLTAREQAAYHRALVGSTGEGIDVDVRVSLLTLEEKHLADMSQWLMGGQVVAADGEVSRSCQISVLDPTKRFGLDSDRPGQAAGLARMISVTYGVWVDELDRYVRAPVFRGPIAKVVRDGDMLEIEALGKEHLMRGAAGFTKVYAAGLTRTGVIRDIARRCGEKRMHVPSQKAKTGKNSIMVSLDRTSVPWSKMTAAAKSMRMSLYYDGAGTLRMRRNPTRTSWWFKEHHFVTEPKITLSDDVVNTVYVKGTAPEGKKKLVESRGYLPAWHAHSPQKLGRNGANRYLPEVIEDEELRTQAEADWARDQRLRELMVESFEVAFDCIPVPHLDRMDVCHLGWGDHPMAFRVRSFTLPLDGSAMSVGYIRETRRRGGPKWRPKPSSKTTKTATSSKTKTTSSTAKKTSTSSRVTSGRATSGRL